MDGVKRWLAAAAAVSMMGAASIASATTFNFIFDDNPAGSGPAEPPYVGSGVFTIADDPGDGVFALTSVGAYSALFDLGGEVFTTTDIVTPASEVTLSITGPAGSEVLQFSSNEPSGFGTGPVGGSIDLVNSAGNLLSFEPPAFGGLNLYLEAESVSDTTIIGGNNYFGNYTAVSGAPEVASWALMIFGLGVAGAFLRFGCRNGSATPA